MILRRNDGARTGQSLALILTERLEGQVLGSVGLVLSPRDPTAELFYWLTPSAWGRGLATEAVERILKVAFIDLELHSVTARVFTFNRSSQRMLHRFGFKYAGRERQVRREGRTWFDLQSYDLLDHEFRGARSNRRRT